jgi:hypothetical protein
MKAPARHQQSGRFTAVICAALLTVAGAVAVGFSEPASASTAATAAAGATVPSRDHFYRASRAALKRTAPGRVLRRRPVSVSLGAGSPDVSATQVLYRTTNQLGRPTATVATIIQPALPSAKVKLLSYQTAYDGLADTCRPSYQLQGGTPAGTSAGGTTITNEYAFLLAYLAQGYTIVTADYEGPTDDYTAGREEGDNTLDAIRAAEYVLRVKPRSTPVGLIGYSGGAIASMWAAERQPAYAPALELNGVAAGGIAVDFFHNLAYISGSATWGGAIPALYLGLMRAYHLDPDTYLNARGQRLVAAYGQGCLGSVDAKGLTFRAILKTRYQHWKQVPELRRIFNATIMGREQTPQAPLLMAVGNQDGIGDGVMVEQDVQQLAYEYCQRKAAVQLQVYPGLDHGSSAVVFEPAALTFLAARYAGLPATDGCASITRGRPLTPVP